MNKKSVSIVIIVVVIIIIALVGIFAGMKANKTPQTGNASLSTTSTTPLVQATVSSTGTGTSSMNISINPQKTYTNPSFSFAYPEAWSIAMVSPFSMTNFNGNYLAGGIIPPGGAVINVVTTTVQVGALPSIMATQLMNATNLSTTTLTVDGVACPAAAFQAAYAPGRTSKNVSVYCQRGEEMWEMELSYGATDTAMAAHVADFNSVLASMKFL